LLWGHLKTIIYAQKPRDIPDLKAKITAEIRAITIPTLVSVMDLMSERLHKCIGINGQQVEV
jgi:hypothetical protein